jgi:hypothetical protein
MARVRSAAVLLCAAALVAGCMGSEPEGTVGDDLVANTQDPGGPDWVKSTADDKPGRVVSEFVNAAASGDIRGLWDRFSSATKERVGPDFKTFESGVAHDFTQTVGGFVKGKFDVVASYETTSACRGCQRLAVASIAGERVDPTTKQKEFESFGAAFVFEKGWKLELFGPIVLTLVVPEERISLANPRVAIDVEAGAPVVEVGIWIDGRQYPSPTEGPSPTQMTLFSEPDEEFAPGNHTVMALASIGTGATATSWTFIIGEDRGGG